MNAQIGRVISANAAFDPDGYRAGKTDGYREGHEGGIKAGGFVDGYETGYEVGYKEGSEDERKGIRRLSPGEKIGEQ